MATTRKSRDTTAARTALVDKLSAATCYQSTSEDVTKAYMSLRERLNLPSYYWSYLSGYYDAIVQTWYRYNLIYAAVWQGNVIEMKWDKIPEEFREYIRKGGKYMAGHYWKNKDGTIGRPFFVSETG